MQFDDEPEEGGDYSAYDPSWRMEREEREKQRKLERAQKQRSRGR